MEGDVCDAAICVIGNLDADGRLNATNEEIAAMGGWSEETVEQARQAVMRLDPVGCGARDVRECLLVQLEVRGESDRLAAKLISDHLPDLQQHKLPNLSKQIGNRYRYAAERIAVYSHSGSVSGPPLLSLKSRS